MCKALRKGIVLAMGLFLFGNVDALDGEAVFCKQNAHRPCVCRSKIDVGILQTKLLLVDDRAIDCRLEGQGAILLNESDGIVIKPDGAGHRRLVF